MKILPAVLAAGLLLGQAPSALAKYVPTEFAELASEAKYIAVGRIESVGDADYSLVVERWLAGDSKANRLRIRRFVDWTCAGRPWPYEAGQRLLVFLESDEGDVLRAMGAACEGEVLLKDGEATMVHPPFALRGPMPEAALLEAVLVWRGTVRRLDGEGGLDAWKTLLGHRNPVVVAAAVEALGKERLRMSREGDWDTGKAAAFPGEALAPAVVALVGKGPAGIRACAAANVLRSLGPEGAEKAAALLEDLLAKGDPESRPAAALGLAALAPDDAARTSAYLQSLGDARIPLEHRRAAAWWASLALGFPGAGSFPLEAIGPAAATTLRGTEDPVILREILDYLSWRFRREGIPDTEDQAALRARWLERLDAKVPRGGK